MDVPAIPGRPDMPERGRTPTVVMIEEIEEYLKMAGNDAKPSAGKGGPKPTKAQITQRRSNGAVDWSLTAKLWGMFSGGKKK